VSESEGENDGFFSNKKREELKDKMASTQYWHQVYAVGVYFFRVAHIFSSMMVCSMIVINLVYDQVLTKRE
jgi:hypothetical protein